MAHRRRAYSRLLAPIVAIGITAGLIATSTSWARAADPHAGSTPTPTVTAQAADTAPTEPPTTPTDAAEPTAQATADETLSASSASAPPASASRSVAASAPAESTVSADTADTASGASFSWHESARQVTGTPGETGVVTITATLVDSDTHAPIAGFRVTATRDGDTGENEIAHATTAENGTFSIAAPVQQDYVRLIFVSGDGPLYIEASGFLSDAQLGYSYDVGTLALTPGAVLARSRTAEASSSVAG